MEAAADHYATLGVAPEADSAEIRAAYRNLMRRFHPDVNRSDDAATKATAINEAYACLGDADARAAYDWQRRSRRPSQSSSGSPAWTPPPRHHPRWENMARVDRDIVVEPHKWNWVNLGVAVLLTVCTFTATSFIPPVAPPPAQALQPDVGAADACPDKQADDAPTACERVGAAPAP